MERAPRILMVDDDDDFSRGIQLILESRGYEFHRAEGFSFAQSMRTKPSHAAFAEVPILTLTDMRSQKGFAFPKPPHQAVFTPADDFLEKPVDAKVLLKTVAGLLRGADRT
ncbi:MAG: hypothetical protein HY748_03190 [Elusimicrobia bacterium]|nr:hypothetical protein [Elusimicrobiota bacterium]